MNALHHLQQAESSLAGQIDRATAVLDTIGTDAAGAMSRLTAAAHAARLRLAEMKAKLLSSVAGVLADLVAFANDLTADLEPAGREETPAPIAATEKGHKPEQMSSNDSSPAPVAAPVTATVPTALGTAAVTVRELAVPDGLLASLGMTAIGPTPDEMPAELENAVRATQEAAAAVAGRMFPNLENIPAEEQAVDHAFPEEQASAGKLFNDINGGNVNRNGKRKRRA